MLVFINGSINSGKTTTSKLLAKKLKAEFINFDDLNDLIPGFDLAKDIPKTFDIGINRINQFNKEGRDVVANYVVRTEDWARLINEIETEDKYLITLAPKLEIAQSNRGTRQLTDWEIARVKYHYGTNIASPKHGHIIDNSCMTIDETVDQILKIIER